MIGKIWWVIAVLCMLWVIYDVVAVNKKLSSTEKVVWVILAIVFSIITAIVYYFIEKR